jgi:hypothetical protein
MSLSYSPTIDDLLADSLIRAVMRADHVEPRALKALLHGVASRIEAPEPVSRRPAIVFVSTANDRRTPSRGGGFAPTARRAVRGREAGCGSAFCC